MERRTGLNPTNEADIVTSFNKARLAFIIPSFNHLVGAQIEQIHNLFSDYQKEIIIIDDGSETPILESPDPGAILITHDQNLGLAQSLVDGYKKSLDTNADIVVRADADGEYPISSIPYAIHILNDPRNIGVFVQHKRSAKSSGLVDATFHNVMGYVEGKLLIGQPLKQHSPGLQIYRSAVIEKMVPILEKYLVERDVRWGLDLLTLRLASQMGQIIPITLDSHIWYERRPIQKIVSQLAGAIKVLLAVKRMN